MAREQMTRAKGRAVESTWFGPLLGAGIGALVAKALQSRMTEGSRARWTAEWPDAAYTPRRPSPSSPYRWAGVEDEPLWSDEAARRVSPAAGAEGERGGLAEAAAGKADEMKERARGVAEHARERFEEASSGVKERVQGTSSKIRERIPDRGAIRESTHEDTGMWALGALALGALFGFALPVSHREREALEPARRKARELGHDLGERIIAKGGEALEAAQARVEGGAEHDEGASPSGGAAANEDASPLH